MSLHEACSFLFADCFMTSILFPLQENLVFPVMLIFERYNVILMVAIATIGTSAGAAANWLLGKVIITAAPEPKDEDAKEILKFIREKGVFLLLLAWIPIFGSFVTAASGAAKIKLKIMLPIVFAVNVAYFVILAIISV